MAADPQTEPTSAARRTSSPTSRSSNNGTSKRENVFTRKLGPLPMWVWVAIIALVVVLYSLWKGRGSSTSTTGQDSANGPGATSLGAALVPPIIVHGRGGRGGKGGSGGGGGDDDDDSKQHHKRKHKGRKHHPGINPGGPNKPPKPNPGGPGPGGPVIPPRHQDEDLDKDDRQHPEEKRPTRAMARAVPGSGPPLGTLQSFTTPQTGVSPSLSQVASQHGTSPDAIVEEATGRGSPHGALWRRYVAEHDWEAPLPHGTDMTILARPQ